jgi:DNA-binding transcriptional ArsR family regulator
MFPGSRREIFEGVGHLPQLEALRRGAPPGVLVRILELLKDGERTVGDLQNELQMDSGGTSQHLGVLRKHGILEGRREGTSVYYTVRDPRIFQLLEVSREILTSSLVESQAVLGELAGLS